MSLKSGLDIAELTMEDIQKAMIAGQPLALRLKGTIMMDAASLGNVHVSKAIDIKMKDPKIIPQIVGHRIAVTSNNTFAILGLAVAAKGMGFLEVMITDDEGPQADYLNANADDVAAIAAGADYTALDYGEGEDPKALIHWINERHCNATLMVEAIRADSEAPITYLDAPIPVQDKKFWAHFSMYVTAAWAGDVYAFADIIVMVKFVTQEADEWKKGIEGELTTR